MKSVLILPCAMLVAAVCTAVYAGVPAQKVVVKFFEGDVSIQNHGDRKWEPLTRASRLDGRTLIMTGERSLVVLTVEDREITIRENNTVRLGDLLSRLQETRGGRDASGIINLLSRAFVREERYRSKTEVVGVRGKERDTRDRVDWIDDYETGKTGNGDRLDSARALYASGRYGDCASELEKMIGSLDATGRREALHLLGLSWYGIGDFARSAECFRKYLSLGETRGPDAATATFLLAMSLSLGGDNKGATEQLERYVKLFPDEARLPDVCLLLGQFYSRGGQGDKAAACYRRIVSDYPGTTAAADAKKEIEAMKR